MAADLELWQVLQPEACGLAQPGAVVEEVAQNQGLFQGGRKAGAGLQLGVGLQVHLESLADEPELVLAFELHQEAGQAGLHSRDLRSSRPESCQS